MNSFGRIMVVDDEEDIRKVITIYLEKVGYEVVSAKDGQDALNKFRKGHFDVILSDLTMPELDGLELLDKIREFDKDVIFLMITGHPSIETAVNAIKKGAYDYIEKPVQLEEMKMKIERAFENKYLKEQLRASRGFTLAFVVSIALWLILAAYIVTKIIK